MNLAEANLAIIERIRDTLLEFVPEDDVDELSGAYGDIAEVLIEALGLDVISVEDDGILTASLDLNGYYADAS